MVIFVLAAVAAYLLCDVLKRSRHPGFVRPRRHAQAAALALFAFLVVGLLVSLVAAQGSSRELGAFLVALVSFFLILGMGCLFYALLTQTDMPIFKWLRGFVGGATFILFAFLLMALYTTPFARDMGAWEYSIFIVTRRISSMPETADALLGVLAGVMCRAFPGWTTIFDGREAAAAVKWPLLFFAGALSSVVLAALVVPYVSALLDRASGVETPYLKLQFATSTADRQLAQSLPRNVLNPDRFEDFPRSLRFIQYDCGQAALEVGGINELRDNFVVRYQDFQNGIAFRNKLIPYFNLIANAERRGYNVEMLKARVRPLAEKFSRLVADPEASTFKDDYEAVWPWLERWSREGGFKEVDDKPTPEEAQRQKEAQRHPEQSDPHWCEPEKHVNAYAVKRLIKNTRFVHGAVAALFDYVDNTEGSILMMSLAKAILDKDINVNGGLAAALYIGGRDLPEILSLVEAEIDSVENQRSTVVTFGKTGNWGEDMEIRTTLLKRYDRAREILRQRQALLWAQMGLQSPEDVSPQEEVPWGKAIKYVEEAYRTHRDQGFASRFQCTDDGDNFTIMDTYAFVKLAFEAHNRQVHRMQPDQKHVREARTVLEDARATLLHTQQQVDEARRRGVPASSCLVPTEIKRWMKRISTHLKLAEAMQPP
jgi:hypothetical protein